MRFQRGFALLALAATCLTAGQAGAGERLVYTGDLPATHGFMRDLAALFQAQTGTVVELRVADASTAIRATGNLLSLTLSSHGRRANTCRHPFAFRL